MKFSVFGVILIALGALSHSLPYQTPVQVPIQPPPIPPPTLPPPPPRPPPNYPCYTQWFDRDDPVGQGDYETLTELRAQFPGMICAYPTAIEVQTLSGVSAFSTGQVFLYYDTVNGFACVNSQQGKLKCLDYKVRFLCPCAWGQKAMPLDNAD